MLEGLENVIKADSARSTKVDCTSSVEEYINRSDWRIKANANTGYSSAGLVNNLAGKMIANYWLDKVYNKKEGDAHRNGDYHIHDLDILGAYCFTADTKIKTVEYGEISIKDLLAKNVDEFTVYSTDYAEKEIELKLESDITKEDAEEYNSHFMTCKAKNLRKTRENAELIKVQFSDNYSVRCTPDHKFLTAGVRMDERYCPVRSFKWVEAKDLKKNDINVICCDGSMVYVKSVANIDEKEDVYCMEVEDTHCFALENGVIAHNCCGHDLMRLLNEGFNGVVDRVGSKAPKHFREALYQMANYIGILQSEWAGAQAFSSFDTYLAPYVFFDMAFGGLTVDDIKKAIRNFVFNLNVPSRWGQSPFSNVTIDVVVPNDLKDIPPNRNDQPIFLDIYEEYKDKLVTDKDTATRWDRFMEALYKRMSKYEQLSHDCTDEDLLYMPTYKHFKEEMEIIDIAFYEVLNEGDINGMPFTFPIPTINVTEDFAWDSKVANVIFENAAKYGSSYFQNFIGSQYKRNPETGELERDPNAYKPNDVRSMCCRLQLDKTQLRKRGGGLFGADAQTGSVGVVTINMARLGYLYKGDEKTLVKKLDGLMELAKSTLEKKRKFVVEMNKRGLYPYTRRYLKTFDTFFSTIGVNGMNEMVRNFTNDEYDITDPRGKEMCIRILDHIRERLMQFQDETGNLYNLEATPAEGTTYRLAKEDKKRFADIIQAGVPEAPYYTNSSQIPASFTADAFEALDLQDDLQCKYTGGTVLHLYMSEPLSSGESCKKLVKSVLSNYRLPYVSVTPTYSICPIHGYIPGNHKYCPLCDKNIMSEHAEELDANS